MLVDAKINHLPVRKDEAPRTTSGKVVNLMDALRKSLGTDRTVVKVPKKPVVSGRAPARKDFGLVKAPAKSAGNRKSA
jgi:DNA end-binding protein Ku